MIHSMTGYGKTVVEDEINVFTIELKSLNSKFADVSVRIPRVLNDKELEVRNIITKELVRGKISVSIDCKKKKEDTPKTYINNENLKYYYDLLKQSAEVVGEEQPMFKTALGMPEVIKTDLEDVDNTSEWNLLQKGLGEAITKINTFRSDEGATLKQALSSYVENIRQSLKEVIAIEPKRKEQVKSKLQEQLNQLNVEINKDRFEQELIYYIEKLDIAEEIVRLTSHLDYFDVELNGNGSGKKLGFIGQEIGREINTIGSKSNYAPMQQFVVLMKEELEKIKEQSLNVL